jgi:hypothetical protein
VRLFAHRLLSRPVVDNAFRIMQLTRDLRTQWCAARATTTGGSSGGSRRSGGPLALLNILLRGGLNHLALVHKSVNGFRRLFECRNGFLLICLQFNHQKKKSKNPQCQQMKIKEKERYFI